VFAFNSVNVEGWGLYSEAITLPYMPDDGKLISLQLRLQRAARAFPIRAADGKVDAGKRPGIPGERSRTLAGLRDPGGGSIYVPRAGAGDRVLLRYLRILELRIAAEKQLGSRFEPLTFHDTILAQGLLPPDLMKKAVLVQLE